MKTNCFKQQVEEFINLLNQEIEKKEESVRMRRKCSIPYVTSWQCCAPKRMDCNESTASSMCPTEEHAKRSWGLNQQKTLLTNVVTGL